MSQVEEKPSKVDTEKSKSGAESGVPVHVGLILDGNRRWAKANGLPAVEGHRQGAETFKSIIEDIYRSGVKYISAYVFSTENWSRTQDEVSYLMKLLLQVVKRDLAELSAKGIRVVVLGSRDQISKEVDEMLDKVEATTANNTKGTLALCFNYGGQLEVVDAVKALVKEGAKADEITVESISEHVYHPEVPPVDMIIRTSGEKRLSNFMLWRASYAELFFTDTYWPDFKAEEWHTMLADYVARHRRFGS